MAQIPHYSIEEAYSFLHQKWNVYRRSTMEWQRDDIEYAISDYVDQMNKELYRELSKGNSNFLKSHASFAKDIEISVEKLESML